MTIKQTRVDANKLIDFSAKALQKLGVPEEDAKITAKMLVASDLRGIDSHGVAHLNMFYARRIKLGIINLHPRPKVFSQASATATIDGDQGLGFVIGHWAMTEAIKRAQKTGAGFITVGNSTHFGAASYYAMMALEYDMIGIAMTNSVAGVVAPGSTKPAVGTNPLAVAVPAQEKPPFVLDMATSVVAGGKLEIARRLGASIPEGWAIDNEGKPITDPNKRTPGEGGLLPLGGNPTQGIYKGFGLGVLVEILCGILSGSGAAILHEGPSEARGNAGDHFFGALRIDSFLPVDKFKKSMDEMIEAFETLPKLPNVKKIFVAGGYEAEITKDRKANGIPLDPPVILSLQELAKELNIEYNL
ncbi:MAG: Ldh family oxidoreductase [Dehalococcoidales bacterium]|nr:Ldh family oxidoreductase [Dehalococcoidales bacterium]